MTTTDREVKLLKQLLQVCTSLYARTISAFNGANNSTNHFSWRGQSWFFSPVTVCAESVSASSSKRGCFVLYVLIWTKSTATRQLVQMGVSVLGWDEYLARHYMTEARAAGSLRKVDNLGPGRDLKLATMMQITWVFSLNPTPHKILAIKMWKPALFVTFINSSPAKSIYLNTETDRFKCRGHCDHCPEPQSTMNSFCCLFPARAQLRGT